MRTLFGLLTLSTTMACSFITDFRDVEDAGQGGEPTTTTGGNGGNGGDGASGGNGGDGGTGGDGGNIVNPCSPCRNCFAPDADQCPNVPTIGESTVLATPDSTPAAIGPTNNVIINDGVRLDDSNDPLVRFVGHFNVRTGAPELEVGNTSLIGAPGAGFVLDQDGELLLAAQACVDTAKFFPDETFFFATALAPNSAAATDDELVIAGAFEGERAVLYTGASAPDCEDLVSPQITGPAGNRNDFTPFIAWFDAQTNELQRTLTPDTAEETRNGYLSDIAALNGPGGPVVGIGMASADPFSSEDFAGDVHYYVVRADGPTNPQVEVLDYRSCKADHYATLDGLRSGIAVDSEEQVWFAGTGCPFALGTGPDQSFLGRMNADLSGLEVRTLGAGNNSMGISRIAVSEDWVVVAGTYTGLPIDEVTSRQDVPSGSDGDGFIMAFDRRTWNDGASPAWFKRIGVDDDPANITGLVIDNGRVFVSGRFGGNGDVVPEEVCFDSAAIGRGRAFFAMFSEETGDLDWLRIDGFEAPVPDGNESDFIAQGTMVLPVTGAVYTATTSHGKMLFTCGESSTGDDDRTRAFLRKFDLP